MEKVKSEHYYINPKYQFKNGKMYVNGNKFIRYDYYTNSYNSSGEFLGLFKVKSDVEEFKNTTDLLLENYPSAMLYNFEFSLIEIPICNNKEKLNDVFNGFKNGCINDLSLEPIYFQYKRDFEYDYNSINPVLPVLVGTKNFTIYQRLGASVKYFDYNKFKNSKALFVKKNPSLTHEAEYLFNHSLELLSNYFCCDVSSLKNKNFDMSSHILKRMNLKIKVKMNQQ